MNHKTTTHPHLEAKDLLALESFFQDQLEGAVWRIGVYDDETDSLEAAGENAVTSLTKLLPGFKKSSNILCLGAHAFNLGHYLADTYGCKVQVFCDAEITSEASYKKLTEMEMPAKMVLSRGLMTALPYDWNIFDMVLSLESFGFHERKEKILRETSYVLKPSGRVLFTLLFQQKESEGEELDWGEKLNLSTLKRFNKLAQNVDLERVLSKDMTGELIKHYDFLHQFFTEMSDKNKKALGQKTVDKFIAWLEAYLTSLQESNLGWGVIQFQKRNV